MVLLKRHLNCRLPFNIKIEVSDSSGHSSVLRYPEDARSHLNIDVPRGEEWKDSLKSLAKAILFPWYEKCAWHSFLLCYTYCRPSRKNRAIPTTRRCRTIILLFLRSISDSTQNMKYREPATVVPEHCADLKWAKWKLQWPCDLPTNALEQALPSPLNR